ncbi:MAG TPA: response regulator transcription factor [Clostridia bacterium]|jgi:DNA-binding NarL/FixJ family response regulator|nr:response regulator transcription factor [Clostridia bacterium]
MNRIRVFLADDHKILRESLVILLSQKENIEVVGAAGDGQEAYRKILELRPDIAVLDISIPRLNGLDLAEKLKAELPEVKVVILTMHKSGEFVSKALCAGVRGYVLKDNALEELIECIELVYANKIYLSQDITGIVVEGFVHNSRETVETGESAISPREREILQLLAEGKSNKDISDLLNLSIKTVETHRANIMRKLNFKNITDLVLYAVRNHIIEP